MFCLNCARFHADCNPEPEDYDSPCNAYQYYEEEGYNPEEIEDIKAEMES